MRRTVLTLSLLLCLVLCVAGICPAQTGSGSKSGWQAANQAELQTFIPARAPVQQERIETEMRTASGIVNGKGEYVAGVILITAGYSAEGKYSDYFVTRHSMKVGDLQLVPGEYVFGYERRQDALIVKFYEAATGKPLGQVEAMLNASIKRVESFRIWPPEDRGVIQIGRFTIPYKMK